MFIEPTTTAAEITHQGNVPSSEWLWIHDLSGKSPIQVVHGESTMKKHQLCPSD